MDDIKEQRKKIGKIIAFAREINNFTIEQLAEKIGVTPNTLKGIESGRFAWDIDLHIKICAALGRSAIGATNQ